MSPSKNSRSLKIEATGDFSQNRICPAIRLKGRWLERAGFIPGGRVRLTTVSPGVMQICYEQDSPPKIA